MKQDKVDNIVLCVGYMSNLISNYFGNGSRFGVEITYSYEKKLLGTAGAIKNAEEYLDDAFICLNGDTYSRFNAQKVYEYHRRKHAEVTIGLAALEDLTGKGIIKVDKQFRILDFAEKSDDAQTTGFVNSGVYVFDRKVLDYIPPGERVSLEYDVFPQLIAHNCPLYGFEIVGGFIDIGTLSGYQELQQLLAKGKKKCV